MSLTAEVLTVRKVDVADAARSESRLISFKLLVDSSIVKSVASTVEESTPDSTWLTAFDASCDCTEIDQMLTELRFIVSEKRITTSPSCMLKSYDSSSGSVVSST